MSASVWEKENKLNDGLKRLKDIPQKIEYVFLCQDGSLRVRAWYIGYAAVLGDPATWVSGMENLFNIECLSEL